MTLLRREFVGACAPALAVEGLAANLPSRRVRLALTGLRGRGRDHINGFASLPDVEIAALCDVDENVLSQALQHVEQLTGRRPAAVADYRRVLEDRSIDAVVIGTPNHWHALQTIWGCQAGKDVYVEKPCSHTILESRQVVAAARKYKRVVQHGTQARSAPAVREAIGKLREGAIGDVYMARALCYKRRDSIGRAPAEAVPKGANYDLWTGPAPIHPFTRNRFHYNWHWFWDYGSGEIGNQAVHEIDVARWGLGVRYPTAVSAMGGNLLFASDQETPSTLLANFEFQEAGKRKLLEVEIRPGITAPDMGIDIGNIFYGSKSILCRKQQGYRIFMGPELRPLPERRGPEHHFANFIEAVRRRDPRHLTADIEEGAISCDLVHLANISYRLGRTLHFDPDTLCCTGDDQANRMFTTTYRAPYTLPAQI